ncbi:hypothetical protein TBLA_0B02460 [Henningerozyma blattae CBS 6284]|uniref:C2H2-type domain-containing protein n=1 Tax=Henningerozyma blattae (strain ATCC 34711 / CBS 6284 / DSM 70876 / NBRC 10599 / NRRL Y-10934 / UCD 77-7) TaxID=1071380 RepID=I2GY86_HENB6|nr:hypothetical protein TBLA_0B02460 [Tetrapisispora blattae CBS 6284]CCH59088.1 hypothetical protein TBLA_0B02460 [Tetrapisispora blattae CBS 6284]
MKRVRGPFEEEFNYSNEVRAKLLHKSHYVICDETPCDNLAIALELYPSHVEQLHTFICSACTANLHDERILELHLEEFHNPLNPPQPDLSNPIKGLRCYEPNCYCRFLNHSHRVHHLRVDHYYPSSFNFDIVYGNMSKK